MMKSLLCDISANKACSKPKAEMQFHIGRNSSGLLRILQLPAH